MKLSWLTGAPRPIGIDIGSRVVKAAQLDASGTRLLAAARLPRNQAGGAILLPEEASMLAGMLARRGFVGADVTLAMHPSRLVSAVLDLPPRHSGAPVADIARAELARIQKIDAETLELGMWDLPTGPRAKPGEAPPAMVVACKRDDAEAALAPLDEAGLTCVGIDVPGPSIVRSLPGASVQGASVILDIGASGATSLVLLGRTPIFERRVPDAGLATLFAQLSQSFELDAAGAHHVLHQFGCVGSAQSPGAADAARMVLAHADLIVRELRTSLAYVAHRYPDMGVAEIVLIGGGAVIPGLAEAIAAGSGVQTRAAGWIDLGIAPGNIGDAPSDLALAIGLARSGRAVVKEAA